jgi:hypothetical protein
MLLLFTPKVIRELSLLAHTSISTTDIWSNFIYSY